MRLRALAALAMFVACSDPTPPDKGEILLTIETDVALPGSVDRIRVEVLSYGVTLFANDFDVGPPGAATYQVPATLGVLEGEKASTPVLIRVIARKLGKVKMLREVTTTVPEARVAVLRVPIRWLCDDSGSEPTPGQFESKCPVGQTCIAGDCHESNEDVGALDSYTTPQSFKHENGGSCFDVVTCMVQGTAAAVDPASCTIAKPAGDATKRNVAMRVQGDGVCDPTNALCYVVLDAAPLDGWQDLGDRVQLPPAVCRRITSGRVLSVVTSETCTTKTERDAVCGDWSSAGRPPAAVDGGSDAGPAPTPDAGVDAGPPNAFTVVGSMATARIAPGAAALPGGKMLVAGGWNTKSGILTSAEIYDEATHAFTPANGAMAVGHLWSGWSAPWPVLPGGKILVAGGLEDTATATAAAELFDPAKGTFAPTGSLARPAIVFGPVTVAGGDALFFGGYDSVAPGAGSVLPQWSDSGPGAMDVQRYDAAQGRFVSAGGMQGPRASGCNALLPSGIVRLLAGVVANTRQSEPRVEDYDPATAKDTPLNDLVGDCLFVATLPNGKLLLQQSTGFALHDPATQDQVTAEKGLLASWTGQILVQLKTGDVLAFGGLISGGLTTSAQVYRVATNSWDTVGSMTVGRIAGNTAAFVLASGDVLVPGGEADSGETAEAEVFHP